MEQESKKLRDIEKLLKENKEVLTKQFKVKEIGIFGSIVRGEDKETSDVDILVEFKEPIGFFKFLELEALIQKVPEDTENPKMEVRR
jgi:predicted nucleotidyltransferase